jgi:glutamate dehydrogenase (NAD(P)+)
VTRRYVAEIIDAIGPEKDVPAPDVNTNEQVMAWVMDTYSMHVGHTETAVVTGKPVELGGSLGRREATGRGVMIAASESAKHLGFHIKGAKVAIQGFGNVGSISADLLAAEAGAVIVGISDWKGGVFNARGPRHPALLEHVGQHKTVAGFPWRRTADERGSVQARRRHPDPGRARKPDHDRERPFHQGEGRRRRGERADDPGREPPPARRGVFVVPDILANSAGVTTSYFEWVQDRYGYFWTEKGSQRAARSEDVRGVQRGAADLAQVQGRHAHGRLHRRDQPGATVTRMRGMYA